MKKNKRFGFGVLLVFLLLFVYRFAFRDDFRVLEIVQITLNALADLIVVVSALLSLLYLQKRIQGGKNKFQQNAILAVAAIIIYGIGVQVLMKLHLLVHLNTTGMTEQFEQIFRRWSYQIFDSYLVVATGMIALWGYGIYGQWLDQKKLTERAEYERTQAELKYLKAQLNPHFIFNTLNNIHFLVEESNDRARTLIRDFSDLLRYQLYKTGSEKVWLKDEAKFLRQYMNVQLIRKEDDFSLDYHEEGIEHSEIAPLLLIIPLENAFKFSPNDAEGFVKVKLNVKDNIINFRVENSINPNIKSERVSGGLGIENLKRRLFLVYGENAHFELSIKDKIAVAELQINLDSEDT